MTKFKVGDEVIIQFEGDHHEPTDRVCGWEDTMAECNGLLGTVSFAHESDGEIYSYSVSATNGSWWSWEPSALKKATRWRVKKAKKDGQV
jgi:hypothetical protein